MKIKTFRQAMTALDRVLVPLGFVRKGPLWNRDRNGYVDVVELQRDGAHVIANYGLFVDGAVALLWPSESPSLRQAPDCVVRRRLTRPGTGKYRADVWLNSTEVDWVDELRGYIVEQVLPFLDGMTRHDLLVAEIEGNRPFMPQDHAYIAFAIAQIGDKTRACEGLAKAIERAPSPQIVKFLTGFADRFGCTSIGAP